MNDKKSLVVPGAALVFFSASFIIRYFAFGQTFYANGWDGYFYINQVRSFMEEGRMHVPDASLIYPLMMFVQLFTDDYVLSFKILAAVLAGAFTMSLLLLTIKWSKDIRIGIVVASVSLFSPHLTYFAAQYPKNLLGVICFLWLLYVVESKNRLLPVLLLALNFFGHRATAVLGFLFLLIGLSLQRIKGLIPYVLILFTALFVAGGFFLPGILNLFDTERFEGMFSVHPQFAPYSFVESFGTELVSGWWLAEIVMGCVVFFMAVVSLIQKNHNTWLISLVLVLSLLIFPFFEWSTDGPAFRFFMIFILLCPLLLIFMLRSVQTRYVLESVTLLLIIFSLFSYKSYDPSKHDPPYDLYDVVGKEILSNVKKDSCGLIIAHKSLAEYIVFSTGIDAMSWIPEYDISGERLWRVAHGVKDIQFSHYLEPTDLQFVHRLTLSYSLIREDCWKKFLLSVEKDNNEDLLQELATWKNPDRMRPKFLMKNRDIR